MDTLFKLASGLELTVYQFMVIAEGFESEAIIEPLEKLKKKAIPKE